MKRFATRLAFLVLTCAPLSAHAQEYLDTVRSEPWVPIAMVPGIGTVTNLSFPSVNDAQVSITTLPFAFRFFGSEFTRVNIGTNGYVSFGGDSATVANNTVIPSTGAPNALIAPLWDDLVQSATANARWGVVGAAPNRAVVIEAGPASRNPASGGTLYYQVWLYEGLEGHFEYRATGMPMAALNATIGYEAPGGTRASNPAGCPTSNTCAAVPEGMTFVSRKGPRPELLGTIALSGGRGALPGQRVVRADLVIRNIGVRTATAVMATVYLSSDMVLDANDPIVGTVGPLDIDTRIAGTSTNTRLTTPASMPPGDYYAILEVDSADDWSEFDEANNLAVASARYATAYDVRPSGISIRAPAGGSVGEPLGLNVSVEQRGLPLSGMVPVRLLASADRTLDASDVELGVVQAMLTGVNGQSVMLTVDIPQLPLGMYYPIAVLDPANAVVEIDENNNTIVGSTRFSVGPDFAITSVTVPAGGEAGMPVTIVTRLDSAGAPYMGPITYALALSADTTLDMLDVPLGMFTVAYNRQDFVDDTRMITLPANLPPGRYYVIARVDPANALMEINETNNTRSSGGTIATAGDYAVIAPVSFQPVMVEPGGTTTVTASLRSLGRAMTATVTYAIYLSTDGALDRTDTALFMGAVRFTAQMTTFGIRQRVTLPSNLPPRSFRVIVAADPEGRIPETDERNNVVVSASRLTVPGADLGISSMAGARTATIGRPYTVTLVVSNSGMLPVRRFQYAYYVSSNIFIRLTDTRVLTSPTATIAAGGTRTFVDQVMFPANTASTSVYLGVIVDAASEVPEISEADNISRIPHAIRVVEPLPNFTADMITTPAVASGRELRVTRRLINDGDAAGDAPYTYYLSTNPTITANDLPIGAFTQRLTAGQRHDATDTVMVPASVPPGPYYVGIIVDPAGVVAEEDESDNFISGPAVELRVAGAITILTEALPRAGLRQPYLVELAADRGAGQVTWSIASGRLPGGLTLTASTGVIKGVPGEAGTSRFTVRAEAGTGRGERELEIVVDAEATNLRIVTVALPAATAGKPYAFTLAAAGGFPQLRWDASGLPAGLMLAPDGTLSGTPAAAGAMRLSVRVTDARGASVMRELGLVVLAADQKLVITTLELPHGVATRSYCEGGTVTLRAAGGTAPLTWSVESGMVPGLTLSGTGELCGTPTTPGTYALDVKVTDAGGLTARAPLLVEVLAAGTLAITTTALPGGTVGAAYSASVSAQQGMTPYTFAVAGALPPGLTMTTQGAISGTPSAEGTFSFHVKVTDASGATNTQLLSITVVRPAREVVEEEKGCGCATTPARGEAAPLSVLLALGVVLMVRRRRF